MNKNVFHVKAVPLEKKNPFVALFIEGDLRKLTLSPQKIQMEGYMFNILPQSQSGWEDVFRLKKRLNTLIIEVAEGYIASSPI